MKAGSQNPQVDFGSCKRLLSWFDENKNACKCSEVLSVFGGRSSKCITLFFLLESNWPAENRHGHQKIERKHIQVESTLVQYSRMEHSI